ncbi:uncharacterized protein LOC119564796 isoform X1 [Chelonia mydas]|uniref:uncharacterized protein LOC119564796 isoform X1 n=2 Tax=Chelonia mydas TaxID=8469 RepID=UPI001CA9072E|nr:uncharacterized protein LOC119564796 isoform X1 [Chelonia mydas]
MGSLVTSAVQSFCLFSAGNTSLQPQANHQLFSCPFGTPCSPLPSNSVSAKVVRFQVKPWTLADEWVKSPTVWGITDPQPKMNVVHALRSERRAGPGVEAMERPNLRAVDQLSPEIKVEKYVLLSLDGKLLGPELSRIRSEMALPLERLDVELPQDLPKGYLSRQRRSLPAFPFSPAKSPCSSPGLRSPRRSTEALCAGHFPLGLSQLVTGMQSPGVASPRGARNPSAQPSVIPAKVTGSKTKAGEGLCHSHGPRMQPESDRKQQQTLGGKGAC